MFSFFKKRAATPALNTVNIGIPVLGMSTDLIVANQESSLPLLANEQDDLNDFVAKLDEALEEVSKAADISKDVNTKVISLNEELAIRGMWSQAKAVISGQNDKDLATMVERLGISLQLTQSAVRVLFAVQGQKHRMLRQFHKVLVEKISFVTTDIETLDEGQKKSVLMFLDELQTQIDDQLRMQETVDRNEKMLLRHKELLAVFGEGLTEIAEAHAHMSEEQRKTSDQFEALKVALSEQIQITEKYLQEKLQTSAKKLSETHEQAIADISSQHQKHHSSVAQQLAQLQRINEIQLTDISQLEKQIKTLQLKQQKQVRISLLISILCSVLVSVTIGFAVWFFL